MYELSRDFFSFSTRREIIFFDPSSNSMKLKIPAINIISKIAYELNDTKFSESKIRDFYLKQRKFKNDYEIFEQFSKEHTSEEINNFLIRRVYEVSLFNPDLDSIIDLIHEREEYFKSSEFRVETFTSNQMMSFNDEIIRIIVKNELDSQVSLSKTSPSIENKILLFASIAMFSYKFEF